MSERPPPAGRDNRRRFSLEHPLCKINIESSVESEKAVRLIHDLKTHGLRIDAVGMQGHCGLNGPSPAVLKMLSVYSKCKG